MTSLYASILGVDFPWLIPTCIQETGVSRYRVGSINCATETIQTSQLYGIERFKGRKPKSDCIEKISIDL